MDTIFMKFRQKSLNSSKKEDQSACIKEKATELAS